VYSPFFYGSIAEAALFIVARSAVLHPRFLPRFLFFQEGLGHFPTSKIPRPAQKRRQGDLRKRVLFSYACYETYFFFGISIL
jgi:hypothetical protein